MAWLPRGAVSALLVVCAGCSSLIGLDEFGPAESGSGASAGAAGQGSAGGSGAQGGVAAHGGSGNASGDAGTGATGGVVTQCSGQPDGQTCALNALDAGLDGGDADVDSSASDAAVSDGGAAERRICLGEQCVVSRCGDGYADDGRGEACDDKRNGDQADGCRDDCQYTCGANEDCVAGLLCVLSQCNQTTHTCGPQTANTCDDQDPCTSDSCNSSNGECINALIDNDGDGYSAQMCKTDGPYAAQGGDCADNSSVSGSASVYPGEMDFYPTPHGIPGLKPFDYNCDGVEEQFLTARQTTNPCQSGWNTVVTLPVPACGESANFTIRLELDGVCKILQVSERTQTCR
ncbi:MAG: hypothetical protein R3B89_04870 [Polyangiaceae bacterium]